MRHFYYLGRFACNKELVFPRKRLARLAACLSKLVSPHRPNSQCSEYVRHRVATCRDYNVVHQLAVRAHQPCVLHLRVQRQRSYPQNVCRGGRDFNPGQENSGKTIANIRLKLAGQTSKVQCTSQKSLFGKTHAS